MPLVPASSIARIFSRANLMQASTMKSLVGFGAALGLWHLTPDQQTQAENLIYTLFGDLTKLLADIQLAYAFINLVKNDHKVILVAPPAEPVYSAADETIRKG